jgi:tetratricopeptide (TPR) repeat protein
MKCDTCGAVIDKDDVFCPECGSEINWQKVDIPAIPRKRNTALFVCVSALFLIAMAAVCIYTYVMKGNVAAYSRAENFANTGKYAEAKEIYDGLGSYRDSPSRSIAMEKAIFYAQGIEKFGFGAYSEARGLFEKSTGFSDADSYIKQIDYLKAEELEAEGRLMDAQSLYKALGSYEDAPQRLEALETAIAEKNEEGYAQGSEALSKGRYAEALSLFAQLGDYRDAQLLAGEARDGLSYQKAEQLYEDGLYYSARTAFRALGGFADSLQMAEKCRQPAPQSKEIFRAPSYRGENECQLALDLPKECANDAYVKIYGSDGDLASSVYLRKGESALVGLKAGAYTVKIGYGKDWYGSKEAFGQDGSYLVVQSSSKKSFEFAAGKRYTLSLFQEGSLEGAAVTLSRF